MAQIHMIADGVLTPNEEVLAKRVLATLHQHYPGHIWGVDVDGAMVNVRNKRIVSQYGYRINTLLMADWALDKEVVKAGGELLERFRQRRGRRDEDSIREQPRDLRGHFVPEM